MRFKKIQNTKFLNNMDRILPWKNIVSLIELNYSNSNLGSSLIKVESMLRIYFIQLWFKLSDEETEETLLVCETVRNFAYLQRGKDLIPGRSEILSFRQLIEQQQLETEFRTVIQQLIKQTNQAPINTVH